MVMRGVLLTSTACAQALELLEFLLHVCSHPNLDMFKMSVWTVGKIAVTIRESAPCRPEGQQRICNVYEQFVSILSQRCRCAPMHSATVVHLSLPRVRTAGRRAHCAEGAHGSVGFRTTSSSSRGRSDRRTSACATTSRMCCATAQPSSVRGASSPSSCRTSRPPRGRSTATGGGAALRRRTTASAPCGTRGCRTGTTCY